MGWRQERVRSGVHARIRQHSVCEV